MTEKTLDEIMSGRGEAVTEQVETRDETRTEAPTRDEGGRFAPKGEDRQPEPQPEPEDGNDPEAKPQGTVPQKALHASRERERQARDEAQALRDEVQQLKGMMQAIATRSQEPAKPVEQPKPVDFWEDPQAFIQQTLTPFQQQIAQQNERLSHSAAIGEFGKEAVQAAYEDMGNALSSDPRAQAEYQRIMQSPHPYGELVNWHRNRTALTEFGNDPAAYREKVRQEIMAELQQSQPQTPSAPAPRLPGDFTKTRNDGPRSAPVFQGPKPLSEITKGSTA